MNVKTMIAILSSVPSEYEVIVREGSDKHKDVKWGELIQGNHTIDHERQQVRFYSEPI